MYKFKVNDLFDYIDLTKKAYKEVATPLAGMKRNFQPEEELAMAYFLAAMSLINRLTETNLCDKLDIQFEAVEDEPL